MSATQEKDVDKFYAFLHELGARIGGQRKLRECTSASGWPSQGVYFFFEDGETRLDGSPRVVRVGTHALTTKSTTTLWNRLSTHRVATSVVPALAEATTEPASSDCMRERHCSPKAIGQAMSAKVGGRKMLIVN